MNNSLISVIIRTYNESKHIKDVLDGICKQTYKNYEVIVVDSESTDATLDIVNNYNVKVVSIRKKDFNYSYASNVGAEAAKGEILVYLSGHSVICKEDYFEKLINIYSEGTVGGVYGDVIPFSDGGIAERLFYWLGYFKNSIKPTFYDTKIHPGILSCSNASILKKLWEEHNFIEELGRGGEDVEMAYYILNSGYKIVFERSLLVRHSHHLSYKEFKAELSNWDTMWLDIIKVLEKKYGYKID